LDKNIFAPYFTLCRRNPNINQGNPNKKKFLFGLSTQKLENPGNPNKKYKIREIQIKNIKSGKSK
jgi:hypothetical protein